MQSIRMNDCIGIVNSMPNGTVAKLPSSKFKKNSSEKQALKMDVNGNIDYSEPSEDTSKNTNFENQGILQQSQRENK